MSKVIASITTSVDGYITGPGDGPESGLGRGGERLHYWVMGGPWTYEGGHDFAMHGRRHPAGAGGRESRRAGHLDGPGDTRGWQAAVRRLRPGHEPAGGQGLQLAVRHPRALHGHEVAA